MAGILKEFQSAGFDHQAYLKATLQAGSTSSFDAERMKIGEAVGEVDKQLQSEVADHHDELIAQVHAVQDIDRKIDAIQASATQLKLSAQRMRYSVSEPWEQVQRNIVQLSNVWDTTQLLRKLGRFLSLLQKLKELQAAGERAGAGRSSVELPKEAATLRGLEEIVQEGSLKGVHVVDRERDWLKATGDAIRSHASEQLRRGLADGSQAETRTAVQAFYSLDQLDRTVQSVLQEMAKELRHTVARELDPQGIMQASEALATDDPREVKMATAALRKIESTLQAVAASTGKVVHLVKVLSRTRDPLSQATYLSVVEKADKPPLVEEFWTQAGALVQDKVHRVVKRFKALADDFPALYLTFANFTRVLRSHLALADGSAESADAAAAARRPESNPSTWRDACLADAASQWRKHASSLLAERASAMLTKLSQTAPKDQAAASASCTLHGETGRGLQVSLQQKLMQGAVDAKPFVSACQQHVSSARSDAALRRMALENVAAAVESLTEKVRLCVVVKHGRNPPGVAVTQQQLCNAIAYGALSQTCDGLDQHCDTQSLRRAEDEAAETDEIAAEAAAAATLSARLQAAREVALQPLQSAFSSLRDSLSAVVASLVEQDLGDDCFQSRTAGVHSGYIQKLEEGIAAAKHGVLCVLEYQRHSSFALEAKELARHLVLLFVRAASLVRPVSEDGKIVIAQDLAQFQISVGGLCSVEQLGRAYKILRAFRTGLFAEAEQLHSALSSRGRHDGMTSELTGTLPPVVLMHLLAQRTPLSSVPRLYGESTRDLLEYAAGLDTAEGEKAALAKGWAAMERWGRSLRKGADELDDLVWECAQALHQRVQGDVR